MVQSGRIKQKYGRKYNKRRSWDLFSHLAKEITTDLKAFKRYNTNSVPSTIHFEVLKQFGYDDKLANEIPDDKWPEIDAESTKRWHEILDKMIWSFEEISLEHPHSPMMNTISEYHNRYPQLPGESFEDFFNSKTNRPEIWDIYDYEEVKRKTEEYNAKVDEGLHLFAEWFENLWD